MCKYVYITLSVTKHFAKIVIMEIEAITLSLLQMGTQGIRLNSGFTLFDGSSTDLKYLNNYLVMTPVCFYQLYLLC